LKLKYDELLSNFAFNCNLRPSIKAHIEDADKMGMPLIIEEFGRAWGISSATCATVRVCFIPIPIQYRYKQLA